MKRRKLDTAFARKRVAMGKPCVGIGAQTVMNMKREAARRTSDTHCGIEQHRRIDAAAKRNRDARIVGQGSKRNADRIENEAVGGRVSGGSHGVTALAVRKAPSKENARLTRPASFP